MERLAQDPVSISRFPFTPEQRGGTRNNPKFLKFRFMLNFSKIFDHF